MSEPTPSPEPARSRRGLGQFSLRTLLLLTAVVGVWIADAKNRRDNEQFSQQLDIMRPLARQLVVEDPSQITVVRQHERWRDQSEWKLHLPPGSYRLCLATREIDPMGLAPIGQSVPLAPGTHDVAIEKKRLGGKQVRVVTVDGHEVLRVEEPSGSDWSSTLGSPYSTNTQLPPDKPMVLLRSRFMDAIADVSTSKAPGNGVLLWIAPEK